MSATQAFRGKWGKYLPQQRANVDQVPLPFVNGLEETYEELRGEHDGWVLLEKA